MNIILYNNKGEVIIFLKYKKFLRICDYIYNQEEYYRIVKRT